MSVPAFSVSTIVSKFRNLFLLLCLAAFLPGWAQEGEAIDLAVEPDVMGIPAGTLAPGRLSR